MVLSLLTRINKVPHTSQIFIQISAEQFDSRIRLLKGAVSDALTTNIGASGNRNYKENQTHSVKEPLSSMRHSILARLGPQNHGNSQNRRYNRRKGNNNGRRTDRFDASSQIRQHPPYFRPDPTAPKYAGHNKAKNRQRHVQDQLDLHENSRMMNSNLNGNIYHQKYQIMQPMSTTTPQQENRNQSVTLSTTATSKVRCFYWPYCNKVDCAFHHPTEACPFFPNCHYTTETCMYVHPTPPLCKYGTQCRNAYCEYGHLSPAYFKNTSNVTCRYDRACKDLFCLFNHPSQNVKEESDPPLTRCKYERKDVP